MIDGLIPGDYRIFTNEIGKGYSNSVLFIIANDNADGIDIRVHRGMTISGVLALEHPENPQAVALLRNIQLVINSGDFNAEDEGLNYNATFSIASDHTFRATGVPPGKISFNVSSSDGAKGLFIKSIQAQNTPANPNTSAVWAQYFTVNPIELTEGQNLEGVRITLGLAECVIKGQIKLQGGELPNGARLEVVITKIGTSRWISTDADPDGRFIADGLTPGQYQIVGLVQRNGDNGKIYIDPSANQTISVTGGENTVILVIDLTPIVKKP